MEAARSAGFTGKNADVRITQYESGARTPQEKMLHALAQGFGVEPYAIDIPNVDNYMGLIQTLFYLEDEYGLEITGPDHDPQLRFSGGTSNRINHHLIAWLKEYYKLKNGEVSEQEYNEWRYTYPKIPAERFKERRDVAREVSKED